MVWDGKYQCCLPDCHLVDMLCVWAVSVFKGFSAQIWLVIRQGRETGADDVLCCVHCSFVGILVAEGAAAKPDSDVTLPETRSI